MKQIKQITVLLIAAALLVSLVPPVSAREDVYVLQLESALGENGYTHSATLDGTRVTEYDYTWHIDPSQAHDQVKNSPAEYFTGTEPSGEDRVYIAHDIRYYPMLDESKFFRAEYDGETEWLYLYEAPGYEEYVFATLPVLRSGFPAWMMHTPEEAWENAVLWITEPGTYRLEGFWHGQIRVDLGDGDRVFSDPDQGVTLILGGVTVQCTVAPGILFASVYECDNGWEDRAVYSAKVDTSGAGARVILADGTLNNVSGTNLYRILRTRYKEEESLDTYPAQKKQYKIDGALYSFASLRISGETGGTGVLNIDSEFEGLNSELHLTIDGGNIRIRSKNDGINVNEDDVSVLTVTGGNLQISAGLGDEGDGIDSNGYVLITGGTVITAAHPASDSGLDSDCGVLIHGGTVVALGSGMDQPDRRSDQRILELSFRNGLDASKPILVTDAQDHALVCVDPSVPEGAENRVYSNMILSAPALQDSEEIRLYIGDLLQCWQEEQGKGGRMPMDKPAGQPPQMPGSADGPPERTEGDFQHHGPAGGSFGFASGGELRGATCTGNVSFSLENGINTYSSVGEFRHDFQAVTGQNRYICGVCGLETEDPQADRYTQPQRSPSAEERNRFPILLAGAGALLLLVLLAAARVLRGRRK